LKLYKELETNLFSKFPKFKAHYERFEALPTIAAYLKPDKYKAKPFLPPTKAVWSPII